MKADSYYLFNILSNKTRWKIINSLLDKERSVNEISKNTNEEQSKISHNLKRLQKCYIVFSRKEGRNKIYYLNKHTIKPLIKIINKHKRKYCKEKCLHNGEIL